MRTLEQDASTTEGPEAAKINKRLSEIGAELAKYPVPPNHPQVSALIEEQERLKVSYREVLISGK